MDWWLGEATQTSAAVCVRATAAGLVSGDTAGESVSITADPAIEDGIVRLDFNLALGTQVTLVEPGGGTALVQLRAAPDTGGCIAWGGCMNIARSFPDELLLRLETDAFVGLGDLPYAEGSIDLFGLLTTSCDKNLADSSNPLNYARHQLQMRRNPGFNLYGRQRPLYLSPDDHDVGINNAQFSESAINLGLDFELSTPWDPVGRAEAQQIVTAGTEGLRWMYQGNPVNADADVDPQPFYYRFRCGDMEVFVLSCINWGIGDNLMRVAASGSMLGPRQKQWLKDRLAASTATFKVILSPKQTLFSTKVNDDSWRGNWGENGSYSAEFREIADYIHAAAGWAVPGGVAWGSSDWHSPGVYAAVAGVDGATADHVCINSALGMDTDGIRDSGPSSPYTRWAVNDPAFIRPESALGTRFWGFGMANSLGDRLELAYVTKAGEIMWSGTVLAGQNRLDEDN